VTVVNWSMLHFCMNIVLMWMLTFHSVFCIKFWKKVTLFAAFFVSIHEIWWILGFIKFFP